jgi:hypothetical protein
MDMEFRALGLAGVVLLGACGFTGAGGARAGGETTQTASQMVANSPPTEEIASALPAGSIILVSSVGDIDVDGRPDVVVALETASAEPEASRSLVLLVRNGAGALEHAGQNDRIVPCAACGGSLGQPSIYLDAGRGFFQLRTEGGTGWLWSNEYLFRRQDGRWLLQSVVQVQHHRTSHEASSTTLTSSDFGEVDFADFDPASLGATREGE